MMQWCFLCKSLVFRELFKDPDQRRCFCAVQAAVSLLKLPVPLNEPYDRFISIVITSRFILLRHTMFFQSLHPLSASAIA